MILTSPSPIAVPPFAEGDRVQERYGWPQHGRDGESSAKRFGLVATVTRRPPNYRGEAGWQIDVQWDGSDHVERGYSGAGLIKVCVPDQRPPVCLPGGQA